MTPSILKFSLPFPDGSGAKIEVLFNKERQCVYIEQSDQSICIEFDDFSWLMEGLEEIGTYIEDEQDEREARESSSDSD